MAIGPEERMDRSVFRASFGSSNRINADPKGPFASENPVHTLPSGSSGFVKPKHADFPFTTESPAPPNLFRRTVSNARRGPKPKQPALGSWIRMEPAILGKNPCAPRPFPMICGRCFCLFSLNKALRRPRGIFIARIPRWFLLARALNRSRPRPLHTTSPKARPSAPRPPAG